MAITHAKRKQDLGQYFTPPDVVDFMYRMAEVMLGGIKLCTGIVDPACGDGEFLRAANSNGRHALPSNLYGFDVDEHVGSHWRDLRERGANLFVHNGLYHFDVLPKISDGWFDLAIGNPPYGGIGLSEIERLAGIGERGKQLDLFWQSVKGARNNKEREKATRRARNIDFEGAEKDRDVRKLSLALRFDFSVWRSNGHALKLQEGQVEKMRRTHDWKEPLALLTGREITALKRYPIEAVFLERFYNLVKPGTGIVAIIIPDGILANANFLYIRRWLAAHMRIEAVVSLPRGTFKGAGTTAKTSILFFRRLDESAKEKTSTGNGQDKVFLASVAESGDVTLESELEEIFTAYERFALGG